MYETEIQKGRSKINLLLLSSGEIIFMFITYSQLL